MFAGQDQRSALDATRIADTAADSHEGVRLLSQHFAIRYICRVRGAAWSRDYYQPRACDETTRQHAIEHLMATWPTDGYRRIAARLKRKGVQVNRKHVARLKREMGL